MVFVISAAIRKVVVVYKLQAAQLFWLYRVPVFKSPIFLNGRRIFAGFCTIQFELISLVVKEKAR